MENKKNIFVGSILFIFIIALVMCATTLVSDFASAHDGKNSEKEWECIMNNNFKSNSTTGVSYSFGNCYYETYNFYESNEKCGTFGFSCYETKEPYTKSYKVTHCFNLKTGEEC